MVVSTILATDMGLHFDYVGKIKEQTERLRLRNTSTINEPRPNQASIDEQERLVLCGTLIKCADISNASRPFHVAERWSSVLLQEMCNQAEIEKEMAVCSGAQPVPTGSTKSLANDAGMQIDSQLGFIHGFAMPLFGSVKEMIPEMSYCVDYLQINHEIWQQRKTEFLKYGGGPIFQPIEHSDDEEELQQPIAPAPKKPSNHSRVKSHNGRPNNSGPKDNNRSGPRRSQHTNEHGSESTSKSNVNNIRRSHNTTNGGSGGNSDSSHGSSSIPRPRTRSKAVTSEGNVNSGNYGQSRSRSNSQQRGSNGHQDNRAGQMNGSTKEPNSRIRTVTSGTTLSVPTSGSVSATSRSGQTREKSGSRPVSPNAQSPSKPSSRGQRSPGRRSQGSNHGHGYHGHGSNMKHEMTAISTSGVEKSENIAIESLLPAMTPALAVVDTDQSKPRDVSVPVSTSESSP
ncbi:3',5'-cyclic-nucleotide phosphodiesterase [Entomortierella beljakovae]|nr:3',5'-cyclic-nucleotide phosphodiesterase [Entomortierella beljakovae]